MNAPDTLPLIISAPTIADLNSSTNDTSVDSLALEVCLKGINKQLTEADLDLSFSPEDMEIYLSLKENKYIITADKVRDLYGLYIASLLKCQAHQRQKIALIDVEIHELEKIIKELTSKTGKELRRKLREACHLAQNHGKTSRQYREASTAEEATLKEYHERLRKETEVTLLKDRRVVIKKTQREFILSRGKRMEKFKDTLRSIQIPISVIREELEKPQAKKKKPTFGLSRKTAAATVVILGASIVGYNMMPEKEQKKPIPWTSTKNLTYPPYPHPGTKIVVIKPPVNSIQGKIVVPQQSEEMVQDRKEAIIALKNKIDTLLESGSPETLYQTINNFKYGKYLFTNFHITTQVHMGDSTRNPQNNYYAEFQCDVIDTKSGTKMRLIPTQSRALNLDDLLASHISFPEELDGSQITEENIARYQSKLGGDIDRQVSTLLGKYGYIKEGITSLALRPTEDELNTVNMIVVIDPNIIITRPLHVSGHLDDTVLSDHAGRDMSTGIGKKIVGVTGKNLANQINTKFTNFINDPRNLEKNICRLYLDNIIASLGRDIQKSTQSIKSAKFIGSKSEKIDNKLIFTISYCSLVDSQGDLLVEDSSTRFDITNRFPRPNWIEKDLFQDPEKKKNFEEQLLEQCKIRFPRNNIFDLDIRGAEITGQINDPGGISHITLAFMTNLGPILLKQNSSYKEEPIRQ